nr:S-adenosylmethionine synthetase N-terminal domain-containing protein [Candidatus Protochlamydia amoebophila]
MACVILVCRGMVFIAGEIPIHATIDYQGIARQTQTIKEIGYENPELGFDYQSCGVITSLSKNSKLLPRSR